MVSQYIPYAEEYYGFIINLRKSSDLYIEVLYNKFSLHNRTVHVLQTYRQYITRFGETSIFIFVTPWGPQHITSCKNGREPESFNDIYHLPNPEDLSS